MPGERPVSDLIEEANDRAAELQKSGHWKAAETIWRRLLAVVGPAATLYANLAGSLWSQARYQEALEATERALELDPKCALGWGNKAQALESLGKVPEALECFRVSEELGWNANLIHWNRSLVLLADGNYEEGFAEYESRITRLPGLYPNLSCPRWKAGDDLLGKTVVCVAEQGIGDTILFSRFLPLLSDRVGPEGKVYFCTEPELVSLLWEYRHWVEFLPLNVPIPKADLHVFVGSLPLLTGCTVESVPKDPGLILKRVKAQDTNKIRVPEPSLKPSLKVGICWRGSPRQDKDRHRSFPLTTLLPLCEDPRVWLYSLQHGASQEIALSGVSDIVYDIMRNPEVADRKLVGTAAAMLQLDLVVTCCTSVAHLAGVLGVPCWVLLGKAPYWIWGKGNVSPWYDSIRLFRTGPDREWPAVVDEVREALTHFKVD